MTTFVILMRKTKKNTDFKNNMFSHYTENGSYNKKIRLILFPKRFTLRLNLRHYGKHNEYVKRGDVKALMNDMLALQMFCRICIALL